MRNRPLIKPLLILAVAVGATRADYINSTVSLGGYVLDAKDATHDGNFYQMERVNVSALKDGLGLRVAYGYSDFYEKRPNTYQNSNRLALANLSYDPGLSWLKVSAGRDFEPMIDRSLYYDGGAAKLQYGGVVQGELFGGYGVPTVYDSDVLNFDGDKALIGGKVTYTPYSFLLLRLDGLVDGKYDDGTLGGLVQGNVGDRITLTANALFNRDSSYFSRAEFSAQMRVRQQDMLQLQYGIQEQKIDSSRNYDYFVNKSHEYLLAGYVLALTKDISASVDYGLLVYDDSAAHTADFKVNAYGAYAEVGKEFGTLTNALELRAGYGRDLCRYFRLAVSAGLTRYDLDATHTDLEAQDLTIQPTALLGRGFEVTASYEFVRNRLYDNDNRFFFGVKEAFFKGLSK